LKASKIIKSIFGNTFFILLLFEIIRAVPYLLIIPTQISAGLSIHKNSYFQHNSSVIKRCAHLGRLCRRPFGLISELILFHQQHFISLHECAGLYAVEVNSAWQFTRIKIHRLVARLFNFVY
jgi:hypothetical protein